MNRKTSRNIAFKIDGQALTAPAGTTVLQAAQQAGIYIPTLCYLENLEPYGGCRLCLVDIKDMRGHPTACTTPVAEGMEIKTNTPELRELRKEILELTLSEHPYTCLVCRDKLSCGSYMHSTRKVSVTTGCNYCANNGICELQELVEYLQLDDMPFPITYRGLPPVKDNPFYEIDYNLCVLCGRCVRICNEERNSEVLTLVERGSSALVGTAFEQSHLDAGCEYCGACVDVCPTGSITEKMGKWVGIPDRSSETTCTYCSVGCTMNVNTRGNRIVNIGAKPGGRTHPPQLCLRGRFTLSDLVHHPERIRMPMIRKGDKWIEVSWEEALHFTASNLERYRGNQFAAIGSAQSSLEDNYILQKFTRKVMRSNNTDLLSSFPDSSLLPKIHEFYASYPPPSIDSITESDVILAIGSQAYQSHPIVENRLRKAYRRGKEVISANSHYTRTSAFATRNVIYQPGEAASFLLALLSECVNRSAGGDAGQINGSLKKLDLEAAQRRSGVSRSEIKQIAKLLAGAKSVAIIAGDDILRDRCSDFNVTALRNIHAGLKNPRRSGIVFLLGDGNHYGGALMGMHPDYLPGFEAVEDEKLLARWSENWNAALSGIAGFSADEMVNRVADDGITAMLIAGDIPAHPNLANLKFVVQQNLFMTETSRYAHVFLPLASTLEAGGHFLDIERKIKSMAPVIAPPESVRPAWQMLTAIAEGMLESGFNYEDAEDIFAELSSNTDLSFTAPKKPGRKFLPVANGFLSREKTAQVPMIVESNYFHYYGNILSALIPDMKAIREEGVFNVSPALAEKLELAEGGEIEVATAFGKASHPVKIIPELAGEMMYFRPNWNHVSLLNKGISANHSLISVEIEKGKHD